MSPLLNRPPLSDDCRNPRAFALKELLVVVGISAALLVLLMLFLQDARQRAKSICCNCNLMQIGMAFKTWGIDHTNLFPMCVSTNSGGSLEYVSTGEMFRHFQVMSNELSNFANSNISYFIGIDAKDDNPQAFLAGDRNIAGGTRLPNGILELRTNNVFGWAPTLHRDFGNVALADGSVEQLSTVRLQEALRWTGLASNRLAMP